MGKVHPNHWSNDQRTLRTNLVRSKDKTTCYTWFLRTQTCVKVFIYYILTFTVTALGFLEHFWFIKCRWWGFKNTCADLCNCCSLHAGWQWQHHRGLASKRPLYPYDHSCAKTAMWNDYLSPYALFNDKQFQQISCICKAIYNMIRMAVWMHPFLQNVIMIVVDRRPLGWIVRCWWH